MMDDYVRTNLPSLNIFIILSKRSIIKIENWLIMDKYFNGMTLIRLIRILEILFHASEHIYRWQKVTKINTEHD